MDVGGNDGAAASNFTAHKFGFDFFALGDEEHFFGKDAFAGQVHLRHVANAVGGGFRFPLFDPSVTQCHRAPSLRSQAGRFVSPATIHAADEKKVWHRGEATATDG